MIKVGLAQLPTLAFKNRSMIESSIFAGCMHCCKTFTIAEIKSFTDNNQTCLCPYCNVDSVIGNSCGFDLNENSLQSANKYWYPKK